MVPPPAPRAHTVRSADEYERRLRSAMSLVAGQTRDAVAKEIRGGIDAQVAAAGGDFARVAPTLDDPTWVGAQMRGVYGVAPWFKALVAVAGALLGLTSVPGVFTGPADGGLAVVVALLSFVTLMALLWVAMGASRPAAALAGIAAAAARAVGFVLPQGGITPLEAATGGEAALFFIATVLIVVVAVVPLLVLRGRGEDA